MEEWARRLKDPEDQDYETVSSRYDREAIPVKSQQYGCLKETQTKTSPTDLSTWIGKIS